MLRTIRTRRRELACHFSTSRYFTNSIDKSVTIGDVTVDNPPRGDSPHLIPDLLTLRGYHEVNSSLPSCHVSHLRWMLQKDLVLKQDFLLIGTPNLARERRQLLLLYATLLGREVEWVSITRDTSEADLKQRKEVFANRTRFINQAPVRAALKGRLLILDGIEKAERNVLPTLNNLLENREMPLDDGSMLVSSEVHAAHKLGLSVHPDFRVAALASLSIGETATLDPPLRSRFQARLVDQVSVGDMLACASARSNGVLSIEKMKDIVKLACEMPDGVSLESVHDAVQYLERHNKSMTPSAVLNAFGVNSTGEMIRVEDIRSPLMMNVNDRGSRNMTNFVDTETTKAIQDLIVAAFESGKRSIALVGPKGCYKSVVARNLAYALHEKIELMSLHPDMTDRDLLMTRTTCKESGNTVWRETPLSRAARDGSWVILDGIDRLRSDILTSLALVFEGMAVMPDGSRFNVSDKFRCIAIGLPPSDKSWINPEVRDMFHWIQATPLAKVELQELLMKLFPDLKKEVLTKILNLQERLDEIVVDNNDDKQSMQLSLRKLKHICRRVEQRPTDLGHIIHSTLMMDFLPDWERGIIEDCFTKCDISVASNARQDISRDSFNDLLKSCKRATTNPLLVPNPRYEENAGQSQVMSGILEAHSVGEKALLIVGYQGVGKNKIVDHLLKILNCEREYLQLHRDTTVQSLLTSPSVEDGRVVYHDSPLVRAAKEGRILVLDEADKAPVEVVALLKGLIEDGQLSLPDGRMLYFGNNVTSDPDIISIHDDFAVWALANPATYPFHGNDLSREMSDVFSCHVVPPMDVVSHKRILKSYGDKVPPLLIDKIVNVWDDLRIAQQEGSMTYPFSIRESVNVIKHLNSFPDDGVEDAIENVLSFDRLDKALSKHLNDIFGGHGIELSNISSSQRLQQRAEGGVSTPKTRASEPKHGKIDPKNEPHIGGNTWAGGTGGSDTAGLGGRGGPYRLDSGHPVHQVSDAMKAEVSDEAARRARTMAKDALQQKLKDINMGNNDWKRYSNLRSRVEEQITQLKSHLREIKKRSEERVWMKKQSSGELDENRLVDALAGERDVFRRRGNPSNVSNLAANEKINIKLLVDISASMYRFNSYDQRLERLLEATLMMMDTMKDDKRFSFNIIGHNGSSAEIPLVNPNTPLDESTQLKVLECMVANTQYTYAGDNTVKAIDLAIAGAAKGELIIVISDANLERYDISVDDLSPLQSPNVHAHLIFIGSLGDEASQLASIIPNKRAQVCFDSSQLPLILKKIVTNSLK